MPGMGTTLGTNNATIVSAFHAALLHQGVVVVAIFFLLAVAWNVLRAAQLRRSSALAAGPAGPAGAAGGAGRGIAVAAREAPGRRLLRIAFGLLWVLDGVLQGQDSMPLGLTAKVMQPAAASSPGWVQHLVNAAATIWSDHPIVAASSAVWIQVGIGMWLLVAPAGRWSRLGGLASASWGVLVWVFGEAFGGIFAPGASWLFGAPGAVLIYVVAGLLLALPTRSWSTRRLGQGVLRVMGAYFVSMAVLQAWPGRGFWEGRAGRGTALGSLAGMSSAMSATPQPHLLSVLVRSFSSFDAAHGWGVNLFVVVSLAAIGTALLSARRRPTRGALAASAVLCLADWILIQDLGFLGGVGTDPNSMIPILLVLAAAYVAATRVPVVAEEPGVVVRLPAPPRSFRERVAANPAYAFRSLAALGALAIALLGAAPMAAASINPVADPILTQAIDGTPNLVDFPAPGFTLTDQSGRTVPLASLRGKVVAMTFLDPVCTSDCPIIAQELKQTDEMLAPVAGRVELVAVVANPVYRSTAVMRAFDRAEGLDHLRNWLYLTGTLHALERAWSDYSIQLAVEPGGAMVAHSDIAYVIDANGRTRAVLSTIPGAGTASARSSFAGVLASVVRSVLPR